MNSCKYNINNIYIPACLIYIWHACKLSVRQTFFVKLYILTIFDPTNLLCNVQDPMYIMNKIWNWNGHKIKSLLNISSQGLGCMFWKWGNSSWEWTLQKFLGENDKKWCSKLSVSISIKHVRNSIVYDFYCHICLLNRFLNIDSK